MDLLQKIENSKIIKADLEYDFADYDYFELRLKNDKNSYSTIRYNFYDYQYKTKQKIRSKEKDDQTLKLINRDLGTNIKDISELEDNEDILKIDNLTVYKYEKFSSLHEINEFDTFSYSDVGKHFLVHVEKIKDDGENFNLYGYEKETQKNRIIKIKYAEYNNEIKRFVVSKKRREDKSQKFEEKTGFNILKNLDITVSLDVLISVREYHGVVWTDYLKQN